jgi:hypothetical protein
MGGSSAYSYLPLLRDDWQSRPDNFLNQTQDIIFCGVQSSWTGSCCVPEDFVPLVRHVHSMVKSVLFTWFALERQCRVDPRPWAWVVNSWSSNFMYFPTSLRFTFQLVRYGANYDADTQPRPLDSKRQTVRLMPNCPTSLWLAAGIWSPWLGWFGPAGIEPLERWISSTTIGRFKSSSGACLVDELLDRSACSISTYSCPAQLSMGIRKFKVFAFTQT